MNIKEWVEDIINKIKEFFKKDSSDQNGDSGEIPSTQGTIKPSQVIWRGPNYANAKTVFSLLNVSMVGTHLNFKTDKPIPWPKSGAKGVNGIGFLIRKKGDKYEGGKTEWVCGDRGWYDIVTNTEDGYNGHTVPNKNEKCWCGIGHPSNGSECSTIVEFTWSRSKMAKILSALSKPQSEFKDFEYKE